MTTLSRRCVWWMGALLCLTWGASAPATAANLESRTVQAYELYVEQAREAFLSRVEVEDVVSPHATISLRRVIASSEEIPVAGDLLDRKS